MRFSQRLPDDLTPSPLARELARATDALDLTQSNPTEVELGPPSAVVARALAAADVQRYAPEPLGLPRARAAVATYRTDAGSPTHPDQVALTASTSEAYAVLLKLLCDPGDSIAVPMPSYPLVPHLAELEAVGVTPYSLYYADGWHIDFATLAQALRAGARAVVVVSPNNPTGNVLSRDEADTLHRLCLEHDAALLSDEVFAPYGTHGRLPSLARDDGALTFVLDGLSKGLALPQLKLGWIAVYGAGAAAAIARLEWILDAYLSVASPVQEAEPALLNEAAAVQEAIRQRLAHNLATLDGALGPVPRARRRRLDGGWYATIALPDDVDEATLVSELLARDHVRVQPGYLYDFAAGQHLIVSLLAPPTRFAAGAAALCQGLTRRLM